jgi:hypothetical protein
VLDNVPPALAQDCEGLQMALTRFANQDLTATYVFIPINTNPDGAEGKAYVHGSRAAPHRSSAIRLPRICIESRIQLSAV